METNSQVTKKKFKIQNSTSDLPESNPQPTHNYPSNNKPKTQSQIQTVDEANSGGPIYFAQSSFEPSSVPTNESEKVSSPSKKRRWKVRQGKIPSGMDTEGPLAQKRIREKEGDGEQGCLKRMKTILISE